MALALAVGLDRAAMQLDEVMGDRQTDAEAAVFARELGVGLAEHLEDVAQEGFRDARAVVADGDLGGRLVAAQADLDRPALGCELDGVGQQVPDDLLQAIGVGDGRSGVGGEDPGHAHAPGLGGRQHGLEGGLDRVGGVDRPRLEAHLAADDPRDVEQVLDALGLRAGAAFGVASSGIRADTGVFADLGGYLLVDAANANLYPVVAGTDGGLTAAEVQQTLRSALAVANRARAQIRQPSGQAAQVTITVVDSFGAVLGLVRTPDAPVFGTDVALQKARSAAFMSNPAAAAELQALPVANYLVPAATSSIAAYVTALRGFVGDPTALANKTAYSTRAIGTLARPFFPDGVSSTGAGPLSKPYAQWSPFSTGLQLDLSHDAIVAAAGGSPAVGCTGLPRLRNGLQIFPGGIPIYRSVLGVPQVVGAIGVSGDGIDQDDMIAFLGLSRAAASLGSGFGQAPANLRADTITLPGGQLRYVQCPQAPFNNSSDQNVCVGL